MGSARQGSREQSAEATDEHGAEQHHQEAGRQTTGNEGDDQQTGGSHTSQVETAWNAWQALQELLTVQRLHFRQSLMDLWICACADGMHDVTC